VSYVDANGVHTYYEEHGAGDPLLLLHGGLADADGFGQQTPAFAARYRVIVPERRAHGRTADVEGPITYDLMADDTIAFMNALGTGPAHLVGWSDGGDVGLLVAIKGPGLVRRLVTMGSNFSADGLRPEAVAAFTPDTATSVIPVMRDMWAEHAVDPERFDVVFEKMQRCWFDYEIPLADLARIAAPTLVMVGDDDIVRFDHTIALYETIRDAQLAVIPGASHLAPIEKPDLVNQLVIEFLAAEGPATTMMPLRRT
jgi:pimeloyl-ACP methyl ester carboxylesterase